jgi:hypothetical protein
MSHFHDRLLDCADCGTHTHESEADGWQLPSNPSRPILCAECRQVRRRAGENHQLNGRTDLLADGAGRS